MSLGATPPALTTHRNSTSRDTVRERELEPGAAHPRLHSEGMSLGATPPALTTRRSSTRGDAVRERDSEPRAAHLR
jgi:hypothetical protein